jgi:hypothetical protein
MKLVLLKLADRANDDGECWPGNASIAKACCISERTLIRHIAELEAFGLLTKQMRYDHDGKRTTSIYRLHLEASLSDKLTPGLSDKSGSDYVTTVSPVLNEEPTIETTDATTKVAAPAPDPIVAEPVTWTGTAWVIDDAVFDQWLSAYANGRSHLDTEDWIEAELAKANLWLNANPRKRKKNMLRFLTGWLTRASESMNKPRYPQPQRRPYH